MISKVLYVNRQEILNKKLKLKYKTEHFEGFSERLVKISRNFIKLNDEILHFSERST